MRIPHPVIALTVLALTVGASGAGCGSSDETTGGGSGDEAAESGTRPGYGEPRSASAEERDGGAPSAPPGASARSCPSEAAGISELRASAVGCEAATAVARAWAAEEGCASPPDASRFACTVRGYRCLGTATERGVSVACARPNRSLSFIARQG